MKRIRRLYRWLHIHYELLELRYVLWLSRRKESDIAFLLIALLTASLLCSVSWGYYRGLNQYEAGMEAGQAQAFEMVRMALLTADQVNPVRIEGTGIELLLWSKGAVIDVRDREKKFEAINVATAQ